MKTKFDDFMNEEYNLDTLKKTIDAGLKLFVIYKGDKYKVNKIKFTDIHDGDLWIEPVDGGNEIKICHDDIEKTIRKLY